MLKMKFWFEGNQLQPDCNIHGGCKIGSSACHACPHCVRVNSKDQEVLCLGDGSEYKEVKLEELRVGDRFKTVKNVYGTLYTVREIKNGKVMVDSDISAEIVPKMQSLPDSAKELIGKTADKDIHYRNQCLVIKRFPSSSVATNYVPDWNDMFAKDWMVL